MIHTTQGTISADKKGHLLLAACNATQPGVFSLSSWDLVGALPIAAESVAERIEDGDYRWINRGGVDLMGSNPKAQQSKFGLRHAETLYGPLGEQLRDSNSFAMQLGRMLKARKKYDIAQGKLLAVPKVEHPAVCILVMQAPGPHIAMVTAMNFSNKPVQEHVDMSTINGLRREKLAGSLFDIVTDERIGKLSSAAHMTIDLPALTARTILIDRVSN